MDSYYRIKEIDDGIYRINSFENVFIELIVGKEKALLLDTGYGFGNLRETVSGITQLPLIVVNSHGHPDHTIGNFQFPQPIYIHKKDIELCRQYNSEASRADALEMCKQSTLEDEVFLPEDFDMEFFIHQGAGELVGIEEGYLFDLGGITLEVLDFPGHTKGSIGLYSRERKLLYVGDVIGPFPWLFFPESVNLDEYRATLKKANELDFDKLCMGHIQRIGTKEDLKWYIDCAENLNYEEGMPCEFPNVKPEIEVRACFKKGCSAKDINDIYLNKVEEPGFAAIAISRDHL